MPTKSEILEKFTKKDLVEICKKYDINYVGLKKGQLIKNISANRTVTKNLLNRLKDDSGQDIKQKIHNLKSNFYDNYVQIRKDKIDNLTQSEADLLAISLFFNTSEMSDLVDLQEELAELGEYQKISKDIWNNITPKQKKAYKVTRQACYHIAEMLNKKLSLINKSPIFREFKHLDNVQNYNKIYYYLYQSRKCYHAQCYDSSIVMVARAIEYIIKKYLEKNNLEVPDKITLYPLIGKMRQNNLERELIDKVVEVQNWDRNICAHDGERYSYGKKEADHSWTAIKVILKDLLSVDFE